MRPTLCTLIERRASLETVAARLRDIRLRYGMSPINGSWWWFRLLMILKEERP